MLEKEKEFVATTIVRDFQRCNCQVRMQLLLLDHRLHMSFTILSSTDCYFYLANACFKLKQYLNFNICS